MRFVPCLSLILGCDPDLPQFDADPASENPDRVGRILLLEGDPGVGADVYQAQCVACHREDGVQGLGPSLPDYVARTAPVDLVTVVIEGQGRMVAVGGTMSDVEIASLAEFLYTDFLVD